MSPPLGSFCLPAWPGLLHTLPQEPSPTLRGGREGRRAPGHRGSRRWGAGVGGVWTCCLRSSLGRGFPASVGGGTRGEGRQGGRRQRVGDLGEGDSESKRQREGAGVEAEAGPRARRGRDGEHPWPEIVPPGRLPVGAGAERRLQGQKP